MNHRDTEDTEKRYSGTQPVSGEGEAVRRVRRGRLIKIAGVVFLVTLLGIYFIIPFPADVSLFLKSYVKGHPEYCEHSVNGTTQIRLAFTPYAKPEKVNGHQIDPNNWRHEPLSHDFLAFHVIVVPYVDYEITQDGGATWKHFWRYRNEINELAWCEAHDSLDENHFWVWTRSHLAITHDGGENWLIQDGGKAWNVGEYPVVRQVTFDTPDRGEIILLYPDTTLRTTDGGRMWQPDPNWTPPRK